MLPPIPPHLVNAANNAQSKQIGRMGLAAGLGLGVGTIMLCCAGTTGSVSSESGVIFGFFGLVAILAGVGGMVLVGVTTANAKSAVNRAITEQQEAYNRQCAEWEQRRATHDRSEQARVDQLAEWGAAGPPPGARRIDIVGGSLWGWEALLTVFGASLLRTRGGLTVVDFTGEETCRELVTLAGASGLTAEVKLLPSQLADTNLLRGLAPRQLVDSLVESMHGDATGASRAQRAQDDRILTAICHALEAGLTLARVATALRVLMGETGAHPALTAAERETIADRLFADEFKRQAHPDLRRMESFIHPLEALGTGHASDLSSAALTCLVEVSDGRSARRELLKDLIIQWLIRRASSRDLTNRSLVIVGADEVSHLHIERLTDLCERQGIRLVLLFRHLRDSSVRAIGGGAVAFMRLANHEEAQQAADFIGRHHKFVLSQLTRTLGGNDTHSVADTQGQQVQESRGWGAGGRQRSWGTSSSWSQSVTNAQGTSWSDAAAAQRVYEYAVEPRTLQDLPDYALLLLKGQRAGSVLQPVEVNPEIVTLPRLMMQPLPDYPFPDPAVAAVPLTGSPTHLTVSQPASLGATGPAPHALANGVLPGWGAGSQPVPPQPGYPQHVVPPPGQQR